MKKISEKLRYDGATAAQVHEMLADPAFREKVCEEQRVLRHTVTIEAHGPGMQVEIDQVQAAHGIPGFAKKFVGDEIHIIQSERWSSPEHGDIHVSIPGKPGEMEGTARLAEDPGGTTETVEMAASVSIPLVGGKIEGLIIDMLRKALRAEHRVGVRWLDGSR